MQYTQNYNLKKPEPADDYNISDFNTNADEIDSKLKALEDKKLDNDVTLGIVNGGTGATTATAARNNIGAAPTSHTSSAKIYGGGTSALYGHVRVSDALTNTTSVYNSTNSCAASSYAVGQLNANKLDNDIIHKTGPLEIKIEDTLVVQGILPETDLSGSNIGHNSKPFKDMFSKGYNTRSASNGTSEVIDYQYFFRGSEGGTFTESGADKGSIGYLAFGAAYSHNVISFNQTGTDMGRVVIKAGNVKCNTINGSAADYAETFQWIDGNVDNEDRVGKFVAITGGKIRFAKSTDSIERLGILSATPVIIGDCAPTEWHDKYLKDIYGRTRIEPVYHQEKRELVDKLDEDGKRIRSEDGSFVQEEVVTVEAGYYDEPLINPEYNETLKYIPRLERPEYSAVGTHGKLVVIDDGTCRVDGLCYPNDDGIATKSDKGFLVMERLDKTHIRVYMK